MKTNSKKTISTLLAVTLVFSLLTALPIMVGAASWTVIIEPSESVSSITTRIQSAIDSASPGDTVYVSGTRTGVMEQLQFIIKNDVTVRWAATFSGVSSNNGDGLLRLWGNGTFEVAEGGSILQTGGPGHTIFTPYNSGTGLILITGGTVSSANNSYTIYTLRSVEVMRGTVENTGIGGAVQIGYNTNQSIKVSGGTVSAKGDGAAINIESSSVTPSVEVSGGTVSSTGGNAINSDAANTTVKLSGGSVTSVGAGAAIRLAGDNSSVAVIGGKVTATAGDAIAVRGRNSSTSVSGGSVTSGGKERSAIFNYGDDSIINVSGTGVVNATADDGYAIYNFGERAVINISGGAVSGRGLSTIHARGENTAITVSGGRVSSVDRIAIFTNGLSASITVNGGLVESTGDSLSSMHAIQFNSTHVTLIINGGTVSCMSSRTVSYLDTSLTSTIAVNGGFVFGCTQDIGRLFSGQNPSISGSAIVCSWDRTSGNTVFTEGSSDDLIILPVGANVAWGNYDMRTGINYKNGANEGFLPIDGITVNEAVAPPPTTTAPSISGPAAMTLTEGYAATSTAAFTITGEPAPTVTKTGSAAISWNDSTKRLEIGAGLGKGTYVIILTAENSVDVDEFAFTLTIEEAIAIPPGSGLMANFHPVNTYIPGQFTDVNENLWYGYYGQGAIANAFEYGLMQGNSPTTFNPTGNITIAEAITVATRVHSIYTTGHQLEFAPIPGAPWYQGNVNYAIDNDIIGAFDFSDYRRAATRAEMAYIFSRSMPVSEFASKNTVNSLPDVNSGTPYYDAILMFYKAGVVGGDEGTWTFRPGDNINRAEAAAIITRVILPGTRFSGRVYG